MLFVDRSDAGKQLAEALKTSIEKDTLVLALPRGGVPVAFALCEILNLPLDIFLVRKLGAPHHEELAIGAICENQEIYINEDLIRDLGVEENYVHQVIAKEKDELQRRINVYRKGQKPRDIQGKQVVLVDDGLATGATMSVAIQGVAKLLPRSICVAVPVAASEAVERCRKNKLVKNVFCLSQPESFCSVGSWYHEFGQTDDAEVVSLLSANRTAHPD